MIISSRSLNLRNPDKMTSYNWLCRPIAMHIFRPVWRFLHLVWKKLTQWLLPVSCRMLIFQIKEWKSLRWRTGFLPVYLPLPVWFITCSPIRKLQKYWKKLTVGLVLHVTSRISKIITSGQKTEGCCWPQFWLTVLIWGWQKWRSPAPG